MRLNMHMEGALNSLIPIVSFSREETEAEQGVSCLKTHCYS